MAILIFGSETGIQCMSESMFMGLCHIVGTSQQVAMRRVVTDIDDIVTDKSKTRNQRSNDKWKSQRRLQDEGI
jgi:hypothetical protein